MSIFGRLRSLLFTDPLIILSTAFFGSLSLLTSLLDSSGERQHQVARWWARSLLLIARVKVQVEGLENLRPGQNYVLVSNHLSFMDIPAVIANVPLQFRFMAKKGLFKVPFIGYHLKRAGHIPVYRGDARASLRTMTETAAILRRGKISILVFPEGGRSPEAMREFKEGAAYIAIKAGVPAVPMALEGIRRVLPMGSVLVSGGQVHVRIGKPIETAGLSLHDRCSLTARLREEVSQLTGADYAVPTVQ